jgi:Uma2 family endonuclease
MAAMPRTELPPDSETEEKTPTLAGLPWGRALTADDLELMPDDGRRYELIDGTLLVSPAPASGHQLVQLALSILLEAHRPKGIRILTAPFEVRLSMSTAVQPDVIVAPYNDLRPKNLPVPPLLAVEVRSPSTALVDVNLKRATYERHGIPSYWLVDPDPDKPSLTVLEIERGQYVERAVVRGGDAYDATVPFSVRLVPAELTRNLHPDD